MLADVDFKAIPYDDNEDHIELTRLGQSRETGTKQALPIEWKEVFTHYADGKAKDQRTTGRGPSRSAGLPSALLKEPTGMQVDAGKTDDKRLDDGKSVPRSQQESDAKRRKSEKPHPSIPLGMKLVDNEGSGNCLFAAVAEALAAQGRTRRTHAEVRNLAVTHLRTHTKTYEGFWRGDAPDSQGTPIKGQGFQEYLKLLGKDGAWGGSLEIAALATTLAQPIFVFRPGEDGVRAFNGGAKGTPIALWFADRHYQALVSDGPRQPLPKAPPAVLGDPADRGGVPSGRPVSTLGGHTERSQLGGETRALTLRQTAATSAASGSAFEIDSEDMPTATKAEHAKRARAECQWRFRANKLAQPDGTFTFQCEACDYKANAKSRSAASAIRTLHCQRHHDGQGLPGPIRVSLDAFCMLPAGAVAAGNYDWKCPLCRYGIPQGQRAKLSKYAMSRGSSEHRQRSHPEVSPKTWQAKAAAQAQARPLTSRRKRAYQQNQAIAKRLVKPPTGYTALQWPRVRRDRGKCELTIKAAWVCDSCKHVYAATAKLSRNAGSHTCCKRHKRLTAKATKSSLKARLQALAAHRKWARKAKHHLEPKQVEHLFEEARRVLLQSARTP